MKARVAVICLCYNHEKYVQEALKSVIDQTYPTELIVVDDSSTDSSVEKIKEFDDGTVSYRLYSEDSNVLTWFYKEMCLADDMLFMSFGNDEKTVLDIELKNQWRKTRSLLLLTAVDTALL